MTDRTIPVADPTAPAVPAGGVRTLLGSAYALMAFGMLTIPVMDVIAKVLTMGGMPGLQVALARFVSQGLFTLAILPVVLAFMGRGGGKRGNTPHRPTLLDRTVADLRASLTWLNAARGLALAGATACFFTGLRTLPLPASAAILFLAPLVLTLLGGLVLGERLTVRRVGLCVAGFPCVLLIVRPGLDGLGWDALYPLAAAVLFAIYFLLTRMAAGQGSPMAMHVAAAGAGSIVLALWLWIGLPMMGSSAVAWPTDPATWVSLASLGIVSTVAHMAIIVAFARAPASVLAPLNYLEIVSATLLAFVVFGTLPDGWTVLGALLIMTIGYAVTRLE